ncbi:MAG: T9SS type A sorting domain-containing protein [Sphingobacteriales bacterium]|nr:MAG: T9SS type A sorting domain-containing protein [Sphingobacteriales bacterium]
MRSALLSCALLFLVLLAPSAKAQRTGSYDTSIAFMGALRTVSVHVPTTYNPANPPRLMVCLHGLGDTCRDYRTALINSLNFPAAFPNTIFLFPESSNRNADYHEPAGNEAIIDQCIRMARAVYGADTNQVILQGFSLGGRAALRYGLNNPQRFKGLLLHTPAVQGVKEAVNGQPLYPFNYANASQIPMYIVNGETDLLYVPPIDSVYERLARNNGKIKHRLIAGMGHTIPALSVTPDIQSFFNNPAVPGKDAEAVRMYTDAVNHCTTPVTANVLVRNNGQDTIRSIRYTLLRGTTPQATGSWTGTMPSFFSAVVPVTIQNLQAGANDLTIRIDSLNGTSADTMIANNTAAGSIYYQSVPDTGLSEGFEGAFPPARWALDPAGDAYSVWAEDNTVARTGQQSLSAFNTILIFDNQGRKEKLVSPLVTVKPNQSILQFDVAYNYHRYTPPYLNPATDFADTLEVEASTDCGATYQPLYKKGGAQLATFASPILNPLSVNACFINPSVSNWRTESISLSGIAGTTPVNALFRFVYTSALGGSINIDNVAVRSTTAVTSVSGTEAFKLYPNPAQEQVVVSGAAGMTLTVVNTLGQVLIRQNLSGTDQTLDVRSLVPGVYQVVVTDESGVRGRQQLLKQ